MNLGEGVDIIGGLGRAPGERAGATAGGVPEIARRLAQLTGAIQRKPTGEVDLHRRLGVALGEEVVGLGLLLILAKPIDLRLRVRGLCRGSAGRLTGLLLLNLFDLPGDLLDITL